MIDLQNTTDDIKIEGAFDPRRIIDKLYSTSGEKLRSIDKPWNDSLKIHYCGYIEGINDAVKIILGNLEKFDD